MSQPQHPKVYLYRRMVQAKLYMDVHYAERIDLDTISGEAFFSRFHFTRLFKKIYGRTPHQYLQQVRLEKAMQLLRESHSVSDACLLVGFESLGSFSSLFRKMTGKSPSAFRAEQQHRQNAHKAKPLQYIPGCFAGRGRQAETAA